MSSGITEAVTTKSICPVSSAVRFYNAKKQKNNTCRNGIAKKLKATYFFKIATKTPYRITYKIIYTYSFNDFLTRATEKVVKSAVEKRGSRRALAESKSWYDRYPVLFGYEVRYTVPSAP